MNSDIKVVYVTPNEGDEEMEIAFPTWAEGSREEDPLAFPKNITADDFKKEADVPTAIGLDGTMLFCCNHCNIAYSDKAFLQKHLLSHKPDPRIEGSREKKDPLAFGKIKTDADPKRTFITTIPLLDHTYVRKQTSKVNNCDKTDRPIVENLVRIIKTECATESGKNNQLKKPLSQNCDKTVVENLERTVKSECATVAGQSKEWEKPLNQEVNEMVLGLDPSATIKAEPVSLSTVLAEFRDSGNSIPNQENIVENNGEQVQPPCSKIVNTEVNQEASLLNTVEANVEQVQPPCSDVVNTEVNQEASLLDDEDDSSREVQLPCSESINTEVNQEQSPKDESSDINRENVQPSCTVSMNVEVNQEPMDESSDINRENVQPSCTVFMNAEVNQEPMDESSDINRENVQPSSTVSMNAEVNQELMEDSENANTKNTTVETNNDISQTCGYCASPFTSLFNLEEHKLQCAPQIQDVSHPEHSNKESCIETSSDEDNVNEHHNSNPTVNKKYSPYKCKICKLDFRSSESLVAHMIQHKVSIGEVLHCKLCGHKSELKNLTEHMLTKHTNKSPNLCKVCEYKSDEYTILENHLFKVHTVNNKCMICKLKCLLSSSLTKHMNTHARLEYVECHECHIKFSKNSDIINHMLNKHTTFPNKYKCSECNFRNHRLSKILEHIRTHTGEKPFACGHCDFRTNVNQTLKLHLKLHTREELYHCNDCNYTTSDRSCLVIHVRTHNGDRPFVCKICKNSFRSVRTLSRHTLIHKPLYDNYKLCDICGKQHKRNNFNKHMSTHNIGVKQFFCASCDYKTDVKTNIMIHMRTHTKEKPYECKECDYKCARASNMLKHRRIHEGLKPYSCNICNYKCSNGSNLKTHIKMHARKLVD